MQRIKTGQNGSDAVVDLSTFSAGLTVKRSDSRACLGRLNRAHRPEVMHPFGGGWVAARTPNVVRTIGQLIYKFLVAIGLTALTE